MDLGVRKAGQDVLAKLNLSGAGKGVENVNTVLKIQELGSGTLVELSDHSVDLDDI